MALGRGSSDFSGWYEPAAIPDDLLSAGMSGTQQIPRPATQDGHFHVNDTKDREVNTSKSSNRLPS